MQRITVTPGVAGLSYSHLLPAGWHRIPVPEEAPDFSEPVFMALSVNMAPYGAVVFTVAARPAFSDGTVRDWMLYVCRREGFEIGEISATRIGDAPAIHCAASQQTDAGPMTLRNVMIEDGDRLIALSAMAPAAIWPALEATFETILQSFRLTDPRGATVPLETEAEPVLG
jgi:hypothetical protein